MAKQLAKIGADAADVIVGFDYSSIAAEYREPLRADAMAIRSNLILAAGYLMDTGERLARWRDVLPHGAWLPWVEAEARMSAQSARDAINVFLRFRDSPLLLEDLDLALPQIAIVRLATASDAAFEDVRDRLVEGDKLRVAEVDEIVKRHRRLAKGEEKAAEVVVDPSCTAPSAADILRELADSARDELVPLIIGRLVQVLHVLEGYEALKPSKKKLEGELRPHAQWLSDALEQITQRRAISDTSLVHKTLLDRQQYEPGPFADAAAFLRDISHSIAWEKIDAADVPRLARRGRGALEAILSPEERRPSSG
ncbi:hypothetical protein ACTDI4_04315 [Mesorhizobium sp. PUT5]|uniref:hypothetical protein n=1 Tax=Mesorhizobium sp. PUT5 TaxID=3454629 RepID=UPI003FA4C23C